MHQRITGPFNGYHVAVYACPMGEMGNDYLGHFKICPQRPPSFSEGACVHHGCCDEVSSDPEIAMRAAELCARAQIAKLPTSQSKVRHWRHAQDSGPGFVDSRPFAFG